MSSRVYFNFIHILYNNIIFLLNFKNPYDVYYSLLTPHISF